MSRRRRCPFIRPSTIHAPTQPPHTSAAPRSPHHLPFLLDRSTNRSPPAAVQCDERAIYRSARAAHLPARQPAHLILDAPPLQCDSQNLSIDPYTHTGRPAASPFIRSVGCRSGSLQLAPLPATTSTSQHHHRPPGWIGHRSASMTIRIWDTYGAQRHAFALRVLAGTVSGLPVQSSRRYNQRRGACSMLGGKHVRVLVRSNVGRNKHRTRSMALLPPFQTELSCDMDRGQKASTRMWQCRPRYFQCNDFEELSPRDGSTLNVIHRHFRWKLSLPEQILCTIRQHQLCGQALPEPSKLHR